MDVPASSFNTSLYPIQSCIVSLLLYGLGRWAFRRRIAILVTWLTVLAVLGGLAAVGGKNFDESFSLPGTESQQALDSLSRTFPQASGTTAQVVVVAQAGASVRDPQIRKTIDRAAAGYEDVDQVEQAVSPFDKYARGVISDDGRAAIISLRFSVESGNITDATFQELAERTAELQAGLGGGQASVGGQAYNDSRPSLSLVEAAGVLVALVVLLLTLGSLRAAGMPLLTALVGVGITMSLVLGATAFTTISSTTPLLALMLGLAVGIDYALFLTSRHRDQLRSGMAPEESVARAVATAGSAVVFAGLTVIIALCGLAVAGIPFLTTMGVVAAIGVGVAVLIALTLLPALLGFGGERLRPRQRSRRSTAGTGRIARGWVRLVTRIPLLTVVVVVAGLGAMAYPAKDLQIALPSNGVADPGTPARVTYDLISEHFGEGYNGPLIVSATIVTSDDPLAVMDGIADEIRALPGVASVPLATPNVDASTGIVQVIPKTGPDTPETKALVRQIRSLQPVFEERYGVPIYVTGYTAVAIDVSDRLGGALLPFGILVVGLSLLLLTMVFRSVAVPLKATLGYLLSVGAAFGATAMVFEYGWFSEELNVAQTAPVISFLPILLMGILFGLAMDYEVFLVSRIREEYVHGGDPDEAIENGFRASSRVVVAAAVIMFAVFAAFVPHGEGPIKTIAFGLAVGVFVDAFAVRMTLVPAVLALLGRAAWWLPSWVDRRLPSFDVEGQGLSHQLALADWPSPDDRHVFVAEDVPLPSGTVSLAVQPGEVLVVDGPHVTDLLLSLSGRMKVAGGRVKVAGFVLPEQAAAVRRRTCFLDAGQPRDLRRELRAIRRANPEVIFVDHADFAVSEVTRLLQDDPGPAVVFGVRDRALLDAPRPELAETARV